MKIIEEGNLITVRGAGRYWASFRRGDFELMGYSSGCTRLPSWPTWLRMARKRARDYVAEF